MVKMAINDYYSHPHEKDSSAWPSFPVKLPSVVQSGKYSDLTLITGRNEYKVHRVVLCTKSPFFDAACDGGFKVPIIDILPSRHRN